MKLFGEEYQFSLLETSRNYTRNSTSNEESIYCDDILFKLGPLSRDNSEYKYGLCPESWVTLGVSSTLLLIYSIILLASIVGLFIFRKEGHIRARNPVHLAMTLIASTLCVLLACSRMIVGRRLFPCALYMFGTLIFPQLTIMPSCIRCIRMYLMYVLNLRKTKLVELKRIASMYIPSSGAPLGHGVEPCSPTSPLSPTFQQHSDFQTLTSMNSVTSTTIDDVFMVNIENEDVDSKMEEFEMNSPRSDEKMISSYSLASHLTTTTTTGTEIIGIEECPIRKVDSPPRRDSKKVDFDTIIIESNTIDRKQLEKIEHHLEEQKSNIPVASKYQKQINVLTYLVSYKMVIPVYLFFLGMHIALYFILGGIESYYQSTTNQQLFVRPGGNFFLFKNGCGMTLYFSITLVLLIAMYIIAEICCLIVSFFGDKDTWHIKRETIAMIIIQILSVLYFLIGMSVPVLVDLVEFFVPSSMVFVIMSICEVLITVLIPVFYSFSQRKKRNENVGNNSSDLCYILSRKRTLKMFLDFARRSYCPEAVICYEHIQHFKKCSKRSKPKVAAKIVETYLRLGSPLELNYPNIQKLHDEYELKINSNESCLENDFFEQISYHCLQDMKELFERFKNQSKEVQTILETRRKTENTPPSSN